MVAIDLIQPTDTCLHVRWDDGVESWYPWLWLRDHAHDEATIHPVTQQRRLDTASLSPDLRATTAEAHDGVARLTWSGEGGVSEVPVEFLRRFRSPGQAHTGAAPRPVMWDAQSISELPISVEFDAVMETDAGLRRWLSTVAAHGFAIVRGTPTTAQATEALIRRVGYVRETIFGGFWEFTADLSKADMAYTNLYLPAHTDGTYCHDAPGLQLLHCLCFDGEGGDSTLVDGFKIADVMRATQPRLFEVLSTVAIPGQYIGDGSHLMSARPVFRHDHAGTLVQVSYNNSDRAPFLLPVVEMTELYAALRAFDQLANSESMQWRQVLRPGDALLFDNWRVLHGRHAYTGKRTMCGAYLNHEDFESRLRLLT
ncbi:MAG TPA: trimethyllysine dioxygenase [Ilumatobacteraceae bacterium]|nr:trimethyllysine dioxygenase [Ilumatobacteraceae bacterium]